jgi:hypothetical protein
MMVIIWKDIYRKSVKQKSPVKNYFIPLEIQKDKFLTKRYTIVLLPPIHNTLRYYRYI